MTRGFPIEPGSPQSFKEYAQNATLEFIDPPGANIRGSGPGTAKVLYRLILNDDQPPVVGHAALEIARFTSPLAIPIVGGRFDWRWTQDSKTYRWRSGSLYAYDFLAYAPEGNSLSRVWEIEVGFRSPKWGADEVPGRCHLPPHERYAEYRWDYIDSSKEVTKGYKVEEQPVDVDDEDKGTQPVPSSELTDIVNTAGVPAGKWNLPQKTTVLRIQWSDRDQFRSKFILDYFDGSINSDTIQIGNAVYGPYILRFLDVEQWYAGDYRGNPYWRVEARFMVAKDRAENFETFPSMGRTQLVDGELQPILKNGIPIAGDVALDKDGKWVNGESEGQEIAQLQYSLFKPVPYKGSIIDKLPFRAGKGNLPSR